MKIQIDDQVRDANSEELAAIKSYRDEVAAEEKIKAEATAKRQALLDRLGITADEARLLLG